MIKLGKFRLVTQSELDSEFASRFKLGVQTGVSYMKGTGIVIGKPAPAKPLARWEREIDEIVKHSEEDNR